MAEKIYVVLSVVFVMLCPPCEGKPDTSLIRTINTWDGARIRQYCDGHDTVTAFFNANDELVQCHVVKQNKTVVSALFHEAIIHPIQQVITTVDVAFYARRCRKFLRDMRRQRRRSDAPKQFHQVKERLLWTDGIKGTLWCGSEPRTNRSDAVGEAKLEDQCCRRLHQCNDTIPGLTIKYRYFNHYPWPLYTCSCAQRFYRCLNKVSTELSRQVGQLYFNVYRSGCFMVENRQECEQYDMWHRVCRRYNTKKVAVSKDTDLF